MKWGLSAKRLAIGEAGSAMAIGLSGWDRRVQGALMSTLLKKNFHSLTSLSRFSSR